ncbi:hypothetical protein HQ545_05555 [Candidatus Woesearchaeota archaeon]|nr:hypothetical protein [Candidatus Woesearchaeota archaeon]
MKYLIVAAMILSILLLARSGMGCKKVLEVSVDITDDFDPEVSYILLEPSEIYELDDGDNISFNLNVYRGKTLKRTIYVWAEDIAGLRISPKSKFSLHKRFSHYNLTANLTFSTCPISSKYRFVAQGMDLNVSKELLFESSCEIAEGVEGVILKGKIDYGAIAPDTIRSGSVFTTRITIKNPTEEYLDVRTWSYVYRNSVSYSGVRELNSKVINLPAQSNITFDLENTVNASPGNYNLKIVLLRSDRKTPHEIKIPIELIEDDIDVKDRPVMKGPVAIISDTEDILSKGATLSIDSKIPARRLSNESYVAYESTSVKARKLSIYFLIAVLSLILIAIVMKRL